MTARMETVLLASLVFVSVVMTGRSSQWDDWWTYDGISGPSYWGVVNPEWKLCSKGKNQSPINIDPRALLFDPTLSNVRLDGERVCGTLSNRGRDVTTTIDEYKKKPFNFSMGPLSYTYRIRLIKIHFGRDDSAGSEHTIDDSPFPAEIHLITYNNELYGNITQAQTSPKGIAVIAIFVQIGDKLNKGLNSLLSALPTIKYKGEQSRVENFEIRDLFPESNQYITYEGSLTQPGCYETVTWIVMNRPIYIDKAQMAQLRALKQGGREHPIMMMSDNRRPLMPIHQRTIRTNINFNHGCNMKRNVYYQANPLRKKK